MTRAPGVLIVNLDIILQLDLVVVPRVNLENILFSRDQVHVCYVQVGKELVCHLIHYV